MDVIEFCPANRAATDLARTEASADLVDRSLARIASTSRDSQIELVRSMECVQLKLGLESESARDRLAKAPAKSAAGAIAQLLAAIRDMRINDDEHRQRAVRLEDAALEYLRSSGAIDPRNARRISRTRAARPIQPASRAISSSDRS